MSEVIIDLLFPFLKKVGLLLPETCSNSRRKSHNSETAESFNNVAKAKKFNMSFLGYS